MTSTNLSPVYNRNSQVPGQEDEFDILGFLKRRKGFIILLAILGGGVAWLIFERQEPIYRSTALVQVIHKNIGVEAGARTIDRQLQDATLVMTSPGLLAAAIERHELLSLALLKGLTVEEATDRIIEMTEVTTGFEKTTLIEVAFEGTLAHETPVVANAISEEYVNTQMENYRDARGDMASLLLSTRDGLHSELKLKEQEYSKFREETGLMGNGVNPHRERQQAYWNQLATLTTEATVLEAELSTLEKALESGDSRDAILMAIGKLTEAPKPDAAAIEETQWTAASDTWVRTMKERLIPLMLEQHALEEEVGLGHPKRQHNQRQIELTRKFIQQHIDAKKAEQLLAVAEQEIEPEIASTDFVAAYVQSLRQKISTNATARQQVQVLTDEAATLARSLAGEENEDRSRRNEIARLNRLFDDTSQQLSEMQMGTEVEAIKAQILVPARTGRLSFPIFPKFIAIGVVLGGFLGVALGYLVEMADRSFRKPEDIIREFGIPLVGHIPYITAKQFGAKKADNDFDASAISIHQPSSRAAEAFRSVRTAVCFSTIGSERSVIQVTSPTAGDGKSTLALNLAISLAISGKKTVLVESDFRRPRVHKLTGTSNELGIVDALRGDAELMDCVQSSAVESLSVLPCGSRPRDPAELLSRPEYGQLLKVLREKFDYVIVDTPPVLVVTDANVVAPRVDSVLLAMRLNRHSRDAGKKSLDQLRDIGATVTGIVINGVEETDGYGSYRYSGYQYRSADYYYGNRSNDYFSDEPAEAVEKKLVSHVEAD